MYIGLIVVLAFIIIYLGLRAATGRGLKRIPAAQLSEWLKEGANRVVVDVREIGEYQGGHFPGAINVPLSQLSHQFHKIPKDRDVALICRSGNRSMQAARFLKKSGYSSLWNVHHGMSGWNGQVEKGKKPGRLKEAVRKG